MLEAIAFLVLSFGPGQSDQTDRWKDCPTGVQVRYDRSCPMIGPHPAHIYFDRNDASITARSRMILDYLAENMRAVRAAGIVDTILLIEAHSDRSEPDGPNLTLSRRRAAAVRRYLIAQGCPVDATRVLSVGISRPAVDASNGGDEADNRRVVIWTLRI